MERTISYKANMEPMAEGGMFPSRKTFRGQQTTKNMGEKKSPEKKTTKRQMIHKTATHKLDNHYFKKMFPVIFGSLTPCPHRLCIDRSMSMSPGAKN